MQQLMANGVSPNFQVPLVLMPWLRSTGPSIHQRLRGTDKGYGGDRTLRRTPRCTGSASYLLTRSAIPPRTNKIASACSTTSYWRAALSGKVKAVRLLVHAYEPAVQCPVLTYGGWDQLGEGAEINVQTEKGRTPLHHAVSPNRTSE
eukprot:3278746-Rhodomonas_salina.1